MKYIRNYKVFENSANLTRDQIDFLDECTNGTWEVNPDTGLIDVQGSFDCDSMELNDFKGLRFGNVSKYFFCNHNNLENLDGSPIEVGESFWCLGNPLISLKGAPLMVNGFVLFNNFQSRYNLTAFLKEIKKDRPGVANELLLTHHFFTPEAIKQKIQEDDNFLKDLLGVWNTLYFEKKQDELTSSLSPEIIKKMNDLWAKKIIEDDDFCKSFCSKYWNTSEFKTKQDELTRTLPPKILQKIKDFSAVSGYL